MRIADGSERRGLFVSRIALSRLSTTGGLLLAVADRSRQSQAGKPSPLSSPHHDNHGDQVRRRSHGMGGALAALQPRGEAIVVAEDARHGLERFSGTESV